MLDEISKKYIITIILAVLVVAIAAAGFGIWRLSKKESESPRQPSMEEILKNLNAPTSTTKTTQNLTKEEKKIIDSLSAPKDNAVIKQEVLNSLTAPK